MQADKSHKDDAYTVVIFRGHSASPLRFSLSKRVVKGIAYVFACLLVVEALLITQYIMKTGEVWELRGLREELLTIRGQTVGFSTTIDDLKRRMLAMKEVNERLRIMLGIDPDKSPDLLNGKGGSEIPIGPESSEAGQGGSESVVPPAVETGSAAADGRLSTAEASASRAELAAHVQDGLTWLQGQVKDQESTLTVLEEVAQEKAERWASMPSIWPVKGWVTSGFGPRVSPFTGQLAMHDGVDIGAAPNAPVQSPAAGRVTAMGFDSKMGNMVRIEHGFGYETQFAHLNKVLVKNGQRVRRGDVVGLVGNTGLSTGPHLHYLLKVNNRPVNPINYILN